MRRLALLVPVVLAGSLALTGCSGGGPGDAAGKSAQSTQTVVEGMHYVQLFHVVDPVVAQLDTNVDSLPPAAELRTAASSLHQFAVQARGLPSAGSGGQTLDRLATVSSTLAGQLATLAAKGTLSPEANEGFTSALDGFQSAAAAARRDVGLPAVVIKRTPHADTGP